MSKLAEVFAAIKSTLHWGPSVEPFHTAVIEEHDALESRVKALEDQATADKGMMAMIREDYANHMAARAGLEKPEYITEETVEVPASQAAVEALAGGPDDAASIVEQEPSGTGANADSDLLAAPPEPVPAGPDDETTATAPEGAELPVETPQDPVTE